jgi:hypothetical protein
MEIHGSLPWLSSDILSFQTVACRLAHQSSGFDNRNKEFRSQDGDWRAELAAFPGTELQLQAKSILESHIALHRDVWGRLQCIEAEDRNPLDQSIAGMDGNIKSTVLEEVRCRRRVAGRGCCAGAVLPEIKTEPE